MHKLREIDVAGPVMESGGSGFITSYLIRQLLSEGSMVHTPLRDQSRQPEAAIIESASSLIARRIVRM